MRNIINSTRPFSKTLVTTFSLAVCFHLSSNALADTADQVPQYLAPAKTQTQAPPKQLEATESLEPDPAKRLTLERFVRGAKRLHGYLSNAVEKASDEDKRFLAKEKLEIERQLANPQAAFDEQFADVEHQLKRLTEQQRLSAPTIKKMRKYFLDTEAGKVTVMLQKLAKDKTLNDETLGEIEYQLGIISQRDQVNFKSALKYFENAAKYSPKNTDFLNTLADMYLTLEDHGAAITTLQKLQTLLPAAPSPLKQQIELKLAKASSMLDKAKQ